MKYEIVFLAEAEDDLNNLFDYIADQSGAVRAQSYVGRIEAACGKLAAFPNRGAPRDDLLPGLRTLSFERRALIAYRIDFSDAELAEIDTYAHEENINLWAKSAEREGPPRK